MGIRIAERATISPEFKEAVVQISVARLKQIKEEMACKAGMQLSLYKQEMGPAVARLARIARDPQAELDMIVTRLRGLPYESFEVVSLGGEHPEVQFLSGTSKEVQIRYGHDLYNLGKYLVRVPFSKIIGRTQPVRRSGEVPAGPVEGENWHFIPLKNTAADWHREYRTPHHYGVWPSYSHTCWGAFNPMINDLTRAADIPELFRTLYIYLSRYDSHSPLHGRLEDGYSFPWAVKTRAGANP